jgi:tRNA pseudouridine55 synthase
MDGILNINKPEGMTSFNVVAKVRRLTSTKKVGHAGTLDPDARGVLPVCVGKATKVIEFLMDKDKSYRVGLLLGRSTDTQDISGRTLDERPVNASDQEIEECIRGFLGKSEQIPPMYSALSIGGKKLYELARQGIEIERKPRAVNFFSINIEDLRRQDAKVYVMLDVSCSKGTYMRTLCHDIGERLGSGGCMESLVRTRSGPFLLENSITLEALEELKNSRQLETAFISMDQAILRFPEVCVSSPEAKRLKNGLEITLNNLPQGFYRIYLENGSFLAIGKVHEQGEGSILKTYKWIGNEDQIL